VLLPAQAPEKDLITLLLETVTRISGPGHCAAPI
jgi:hypothetical protein